MNESSRFFWYEIQVSIHKDIIQNKIRIKEDQNRSRHYFQIFDLACSYWKAFYTLCFTIQFFKTKRHRFLLPDALNTWSKWSRQWVRVPPGQTGCRWDLQGRCRPRWRCSCQSEHPTRCKTTQQQPHTVASGALRKLTRKRTKHEKYASGRQRSRFQRQLLFKAGPRCSSTTSRKSSVCLISRGSGQVQSATSPSARN